MLVYQRVPTSKLGHHGFLASIPIGSILRSTACSKGGYRPCPFFEQHSYVNVEKLDPWKVWRKASSSSSSSGWWF